jgi:hypothetical protein
MEIDRQLVSLLFSLAYADSGLDKRFCWGICGDILQRVWNEGFARA